MRNLILLGTEGCHLCEVAEQLLVTSLSAEYFSVEVADIVDEEDWLTLYAEKIPVLLDEQSGAALCWPFGQEQLMGFLQDLG